MKSGVKITKNGSGEAVAFEVVTNASGEDAALRLTAPLNYDTSYTITATTAIRSQDGRSLDRNYSQAFLTQFRPYLINIPSFVVTTRYDTAHIRVTVVNLGEAITARGTITASCQEQGYPSLSTTLEGPLPQLAAGGRIDVILRHSAGFRYFTDGAVSCSFSAKTADGERDVTIQ